MIMHLNFHITENKIFLQRKSFVSWEFTDIICLKFLLDKFLTILFFSHLVTLCFD